MLTYSYSLKCHYISSKYCLTSTLLFIEKILYLEMDNHSSIRKEKYKTSNILMSIWGWVKGSIFSFLNIVVSNLNLSSNGKIIESIFLYNLHRYKFYTMYFIWLKKVLLLQEEFLIDWTVNGRLQISLQYSKIRLLLNIGTLLHTNEVLSHSVCVFFCQLA